MKKLKTSEIFELWGISSYFYCKLTWMRKQIWKANKMTQNKTNKEKNDITILFFIVTIYVAVFCRQTLTSS